MHTTTAGALVALAAFTACGASSAHGTHSGPDVTGAPIAAPSAANDPYADLAALGRAIGAARVVALGESRHDVGNLDAENAHVIAFLHERLGFNVIAWEAGLWSCESAGGDVTHCLAPPWSIMEEARTVRELGPSSGFVQTGFDIQMSGRLVEYNRGRQALRQAVAAHLTAHPDVLARFDDAFTRFPKVRDFLKLTKEQRDTDEASVRVALQAVKETGDARERAGILLARALENVLALYAWHRDVHADVSTDIDWNLHTEVNNVRDREMANNVLWLMDTLYPGQKVILWVASMHAARDPWRITNLREPAYNDAFKSYVTMGTVLKERLGPAYFSLATTAYAGTAGNPPGPLSTIAPALPGSLEDRFRPQGDGFQFVELRTQAALPMRARFLGLGDCMAPWGDVFDAAFVFDHVTPTTPPPSPVPAGPAVTVGK